MQSDNLPRELQSKLQSTRQFITEYADKSRFAGRRLVMTSSFQTQSVPLLHMVTQNFPQTEILFIDTGFLFAETYEFKDRLSAIMGFTPVELRADSSYAGQIDARGLFIYASDTDKCCRINKVEPLQNYLKDGDYWISGVRRDQTANRANKQAVETDERGITRLHPMLDWTAKDVYQYINHFNLPKHPLDLAGYESIGCVPCTHPCGDSRGGRWEGSKKTECGLHT